MSEVKLVKKWVAADGSEHDTKQAAEQNERFVKAQEIVSAGGTAHQTVVTLLEAGLLALKVKRERKPRAPKVVKEVPVKVKNGPAKAAA